MQLHIIFLRNLKSILKNFYGFITVFLSKYFKIHIILPVDYFSNSVGFGKLLGTILPMKIFSKVVFIVCV